MANPSTCGQGLAEHSTLPAALSAFFSAVAQNLEIHLIALDPSDKNAKPEYDAYVALAKQNRELVAQLRATAGHMADCRDLPMPAHDPVAMGSPKVRDAFEEFVRQEQALLALLQKQVQRDRAMLTQFTSQDNRT